MSLLQQIQEAYSKLTDKQKTKVMVNSYILSLEDLLDYIKSIK